jgi:peptidoglycan-N-acetylglucosamine deacetylase
MYLIKTPSILRHLYHDLIWRVDTSEREIFLTFDDGPTVGVTDEVLSMLDAFQAQATFFCLGKNVMEQPQLYAQILQQGNQTGNHTWDHPDGWKTKKDLYLSNLEQAQQLIQSNLFRPPYGRITRSQLRAIRSNYKIVMWDVMSGDFDRTNSPQRCFENVRQNVRAGSIVVFHDSMKAKNNMMPALEMSLNYFTSEGYTLRKINT